MALRDGTRMWLGYQDSSGGHYQENKRSFSIAVALHHILYLAKDIHTSYAHTYEQH